MIENVFPRILLLVLKALDSGGTVAPNPVAYLVGSGMVCPKCKTDNAHRSRRVSTWDRFTTVMGYSPYRCHQCSHRFQAFIHHRNYPRLPPTNAEREIAHTVGASHWKRRRREIWLYGSALTVFVVVLYLLTRPPSIGE